MPNPIKYMMKGQYMALSGTVSDQNNQPMSGADPTFVSSAPSIVRIDVLPSGAVMAAAIAAGTSTITATSGSATAALDITVVAVQTPTAVAINTGYVENNGNG